ncbi:hypothetical protein BKA62DRAFT_767419 [Auriculariales sp. MPI-PUGE-AT-0066]|nr:hypothetical protein BKA62DRAFT_767419 [Auriculariales sp. MPI-PUGE-AT-0066]
MASTDQLRLPIEILQPVFELVARETALDGPPCVADIVAVSSWVRDWVLPILYTVLVIDTRVPRRCKLFDYLALHPESSARAHVRHIVFLGQLRSHTILGASFSVRNRLPPPARKSSASPWQVESVAGYGSFAISGLLRARYVHFVGPVYPFYASISSRSAYAKHAVAARSLGASRMRFRLSPQLDDVWTLHNSMRAWSSDSFVSDVRVQLVLPSNADDVPAALAIVVKMVGNAVSALRHLSGNLAFRLESPVLVDGVPDEVATVQHLRDLIAQIDSLALGRVATIIHSAFARHSLDPDTAAMDYAKHLWRQLDESKGRPMTPEVSSDLEDDDLC